MRNMNRFGLLLLILAVVLVPACSKQAPPAPEPQPEPPAPAPEPTPPPPLAPDPAGEWEAAPPAEATLTPEEINRMGVLRTIYFDYDRSEIRADQRPTLQANAAWLREHADVMILIEGHCDERGTREYNLSLGDRRAAASRDYMMSLGIGAERIEMITYGEERPVDAGHDESGWARNRRGEFVVVAVGN